MTRLRMDSDGALKEVKPKAAKRTRGLKAGSLCGSCFGRLYNVFALCRGDCCRLNDAIERVACASCHRSFESCERGLSLKQIREQQLIGFKNPRREPTQCICGSKELDSTFLHRGPAYAPLIDYRFCKKCDTIVWSATQHRALERDRKMARIVKPMGKRKVEKMLRDLDQMAKKKGA